MKRIALTLIALAASALTVSAQSDPQALEKELQKLKAESADKSARIQDLQKQLDQAKTLAERAEKDLGTLEEKHVEQARRNKQAADLVKMLGVLSGESLKTHVTAVADEIGLVVISAGTENGVKEGDDFKISRNGWFIAQVKVDRTDRKWCAAKVIQKSGNPQVGDDAAKLYKSHLEAPAPVVAVPAVPAAPAPDEHYRQAERYLQDNDLEKARQECQKALKIDPSHLPAKALLADLNFRSKPALSRSSADELQSLRKELDEVRGQVRQLSDRLVPSWQGAGVAVEEAPEELRAHLGIPRGLLVRRVREGSAAEKAGLKAHDVIPELGEPQLLDALEKRVSIPLIRQGQRMNTPSPK